MRPRASYVGRASRLTQSATRPRARRPRYISEVQKQTAFRISDYFLKTGMVLCGFDPLLIVGNNHFRFSNI